MIWNLVREQYRSQRRVTSTSALMIMVTMVLTSFGGFYIASEFATQHMNDVPPFEVGKPTQHTLSMFTWEDDDSRLDLQSPYDSVSREVAAGWMADIADTSPNAYFVRRFELPGVPPEEDWQDPEFNDIHVEAWQGDIPWGELLVSGRAPRPGEIVLTADAARMYNVEVGDWIEFSRTIRVPDARFVRKSDHSLVLVGIARERFTLLGNYSPGNFVNWDDSEVLATEFPDFAVANTRAEPVARISTRAYWDGTVPEWVDTKGANYYRVDPNRGKGTSMEWITAVSDTPLWIFTAVVWALPAIIAIIALLALGRNQAQSRQTWIASARALGARKADIAGVVILESSLVAFVAGGLGTIVGWFATWGVLAAGHGRTPDEALHTPSAPTSLIVLMLGISLALGLIMAAGPTVRAMKVSPVAALKPVAASRDYEVKRRISVTWLVVGTVVAFFLPRLVLAFFPSQPSLSNVLLDISIYGLLLGLLLLGLKLIRVIITRAARALRSLGRPWAEAAGASLLSDPRQVLFPGALMLFSSAGVFHASVGWEGLFESLAISAVLLLVPAIVSVIVGVSNARANTATSATNEALGLSRLGTMKASFIQLVVPMVTGGLLGILPMWLTYTLLPGSHEAIPGTGHVSDIVAASMNTALAVAIIVVCYALLASAIVALSTRRKAPIEQLLRTP